MERVTVSLPRELLDQLRTLAVERRMPLAALVREALQEEVARHRPRPSSLGVGASGSTDTARRASDMRPDKRSRG